jgi:hypothetical protein
MRSRSNTTSQIRHKECLDLFLTFQSLRNNNFQLFLVVFLSIGLIIFGISEYVFGTAETDNLDFNFVAAGDFGCGKNANRTITNMLAREPEVVIGLGDLSYQKTADCWFHVVSPLDTVD